MSAPSTPLAPAIEAVEGAAALDGPAKALGKWVRGAFGREPLKDALSGTWLGHAVHPMLTDVVVGAFLSSTLLDLLGGDDGERARRRLVGVGIAAAGPTVLTGGNDRGGAGRRRGTPRGPCARSLQRHRPCAVRELAGERWAPRLRPARGRRRGAA